MKKKFPQEVNVFDKRGRALKPCSMFRAKQMIKRNKAVWIGPFMVQLMYDRDDIKKFKKYVLKRDGGRCYIDEQIYPPEELTVDHIRAKHKGGSDYPENLGCCSLKYNQLKGNMSLEDYIIFLIHSESTDGALRSRLIARFPHYIEKGAQHEYTGTTTVPDISSSAAD